MAARQQERSGEDDPGPRDARGAEDAGGAMAAYEGAGWFGELPAPVEGQLHFARRCARLRHGEAFRHRPGGGGHRLAEQIGTFTRQGGPGSWRP